MRNTPLRVNVAQKSSNTITFVVRDVDNDFLVLQTLGLGENVFKYTYTGDQSAARIQFQITGAGYYVIDDFSISGVGMETQYPFENIYTADVVSYSDFSPYGVQLDNRHGEESDRKVKYGYQGSEMDDEIKGEGNSYVTEYRLLDPRIGRWISIDPVLHPWQSPYASMNNNPIWFNDADGQKGDKNGSNVDRKTRKEYNKLRKEGEKLSKQSLKAAKNELKSINGEGEIVSWTDKNKLKHYNVKADDGSYIASPEGHDVANKWDEFDKRADPIYEKVLGKYYEAGEAIGIQFSFGGSFVLGGGGSYSIDFTFVGDTYSIGNTIGGGIGLELGGEISSQFVFAEKAGRYTAMDVQAGQGFTFSVGIGPANYTRSGDLESASQFAWFGENTTSSNLGWNQDMFIQSAKILAGKNAKLVSEIIILGSRLGKPKITASYQWTQGYQWFGN